MKTRFYNAAYWVFFILIFASCEKTNHENIAPSPSDSTSTTLEIRDTLEQKIFIVSFIDTNTINVLGNNTLDQFVDVADDIKTGDSIIQVNSSDVTATFSLISSSVANTVSLSESGIVTVQNETIFQTVDKIDLQISASGNNSSTQTIQVIIRIGHKENTIVSSISPLHYFNFNNSSYADFYGNTTVTPSGDDLFFGTDSSGNLNSTYSGASGKIITLDNINANIEEDFTVSLNFKVRADASKDALHYLITSRRGSANLPEAGGFSLFINTDQRISLVFRRKNDVNLWANTVLNIKTDNDTVEFDSWYHLVLRKTGGKVELFMNEEKVTEGIFNDFPGNNPKWQIGGLGDLNGSSIRNLDGLLDNLIIWDRAISDQELNESQLFTP